MERHTHTDGVFSKKKKNTKKDVTQHKIGGFLERETFAPAAQPPLCPEAGAKREP